MTPAPSCMDFIALLLIVFILAWLVVEIGARNHE